MLSYTSLSLLFLILFLALVASMSDMAHFCRAPKAPRPSDGIFKSQPVGLLFVTVITRGVTSVTDNGRIPSLEKG